ncbi:MAG: hypothetical protein HYZ51_03005 [Candidatus Doudnabacteria bacterium]|nr:hypothetical protein [Candidatus Doudnabacteria bacterium]
MTITEELRNRIAPHLPDSFRGIIAKQTGYSESMVSKVLNEGQPNVKIAAALIELARKTKEENEKEQERLKRLADQL